MCYISRFINPYAGGGSMIHVAIVEDESKAREALKACLAYVAEKNQTEIQITEFVSGTAFLGGYQPI